MSYKRIMNCSCEHIEGKKVIPHSHSSFGITVKDMGESYEGTYIDRKPLSLENNFCPQCGTEITKIPLKSYWERVESEEK